MHHFRLRYIDVCCRLLRFSSSKYKKMHFCGRACQDPVAGFTGSLYGRERKEGKGREERREREGGEGLPVTYQMDLAYRFVMLRLDFYTQIVKPNAA